MESTRSTSQISHQVSRVIFFDGYCVLCNRWVDILLKALQAREKDSTLLSFQVASLQGKTAKQILVETGRGDLLLPPFKTIVLYEKATHEQGTVFLIESDAVLRIFTFLGGKWKWLHLFRFTPRKFRNWLYRVISENRYQWFGKQDTCRVPTPEERSFFLD